MLGAIAEVSKEALEGRRNGESDIARLGGG
jgi:hypothetical protein